MDARTWWLLLIGFLAGVSVMAMVLCHLEAKQGD